MSCSLSRQTRKLSSILLQFFVLLTVPWRITIICCAGTLGIPEVQTLDCHHHGLNFIFFSIATVKLMTLMKKSGGRASGPAGGSVNEPRGERKEKRSAVSTHPSTVTDNARYDGNTVKIDKSLLSFQHLPPRQRKEITLTKKLSPPKKRIVLYVCAIWAL